jgi:hypothetical protein
MLTLFWLFFMSATFLIRIDVPDSPSIAHDSSLETAGETAFLYGLGLDADIEGDNRLTELLNSSNFDGACELLQDAIISGKDSNCWIGKNSATSSPYGLVGTPSGTTFAVHRLIAVDNNMWTVTLDIWSTGGGA